MIQFYVERGILSYAEEVWSVHEDDLPENWNSLDKDEQFEWIEYHAEDVYTRNEYQEGTEEIYIVKRGTEK